MEIGLIGLPNVGKSTLFNALLKKQVALAANYPFATIEPNVGVVGVPDERLEKLREVVEMGLPSSAKATEGYAQRKVPIVPATVRFVDIAGLVKGSSVGAGLGNKFLSHVREVDAVVHVIRGFSDENVIRAGSVNPDSDSTVIETELQLADLEVVGKLVEANKKDNLNPDQKTAAVLLQQMQEKLAAGRSAAEVEVGEKMGKWRKGLPLLTLKPVIKVLNVDADKLENFPNYDGVVLSAQLESELGDEIADLGIAESGLVKLIKKSYEILGLQSFLTAGEKEVRAWTVRRGAKAPEAAGVIHSDFEKHFIKADVISWQEFVEMGGWQKAREAGKVRMEGRDYVMQDNDVVEFKIGN